MRKGRCKRTSNYIHISWFPTTSAGELHSQHEHVMIVLHSVNFKYYSEAVELVNLNLLLLSSIRT
jgi:hypothetical protein